jgi:hypothetical protein
MTVNGLADWPTDQCKTAAYGVPCHSTEDRFATRVSIRTGAEGES